MVYPFIFLYSVLFFFTMTFGVKAFCDTRLPVDGSETLTWYVSMCSDVLPSLKTNSSPLRMDGWKIFINFLLGNPIFRCDLLVSGRVIQPKFSRIGQPIKDI